MYTRLQAEGFERRFGNLFRALYRGFEPRKASFRNLHWRFVLLPMHSFNTQTVFEAFCHACRRAGDTEIVVTDLDFEPRHQWSVLISCDLQSYERALWDADQGFLVVATKAMFGPSGNWAAMEGHSFGRLASYVIVGGERPFMDELLASQGGEECLRNEFVRYLNDPIVKPSVPQESQLSLLSDAGW